MQERSRRSEGRHVYDPRDFGWTYEGLAEAFRAYRERYDIPQEREISPSRCDRPD
ncbi:MAG: hypothetical protein JRH19_11100 [Deltaproteobacteria bacterium]|nr:hypothetical protein [Deltaproteobacteria bacterium]